MTYPVIQADREAAAALFPDEKLGHRRQYVAEAFARHRIEHTCRNAVLTLSAVRTFVRHDDDCHITHEGKEDPVSALIEDRRREQLYALGWTAWRTSLYDEEGVEGFCWKGPNGEEYTVIGEHSEPPPIPEELEDP